jgi:uncharacterized protein YjiS (DUF1127 family)
MIGKLHNWIKNRAAYMQTYRELDSMTDRELNDIGIDRSMIEEIASTAIRKVVTEEPTTSSLVTAVTEFFKVKKKPSEKDRVYAWLSESSDIVDLERRLKMLDLQQAPWQTTSNRNLQGWV